MKATVVEIKGKYAVLLQEDGSFIKMRTTHLKSGDIVSRKVTHVCRNKKIGSMVAAALFAVLIGGGVYTYGAPSYYVSLDVNPGITMEVNRFERVIGLEAANVEAEEVLEGLTLENKGIEDAVFLAVERITDLGYFEEEGGNILITAMAEEEEEAMRVALKLEDAVKEELEENGSKAEVISKVIGYEMVQAAREFDGMTPGKYNIIVNLLGVDPERVEEYAATSIKDIMKEYKALKDAVETQKVGEAPSEKKSEKLKEKLIKQEEKLSDKSDRSAQKAADKAERKNNSLDESLKDDVEASDSDESKKNTGKKSEKSKDAEKEEKKERKLGRPEGFDDREESEKPEKQGKPETPGKRP